MLKIALFGSSRTVDSKDLSKSLMDLAVILKQFHIIHCATNKGFIKELTSLLLEYNCKITGYVSSDYKDDINKDIKDIIHCGSSNNRRKKLINDSDIIIILPGGFGTAVEVFDILDMLQNKTFTKKVILINYHNYWKGILSQIQSMKDLKLISDYNIVIANTQNELINSICEDTN